MVDGGDDVEFKLAVRAGLEYSGVDFDLLDTRTKELAQSRYNSRLFASPGWSVDQKMRKVPARSL